MRKFPIVEMKRGDAITVTTSDGTVTGSVRGWTGAIGEGFAVQVEVPGGGYRWFYTREGAKFWH